jgi:hypothetical protein
MGKSSALPVAWVSLRILVLLNILSGIAILALLLATVVARDWTFTALGITPASGIPQVMLGLQLVAVLGIVAVVINHGILKRLLAIVETVGIGDPFVAANAYRLQAVAWALLGLQLLSIAIAVIGKMISTAEHPIRLDAGFSVNGWLAVVLTFVLARVFAEGTLMREDLDGTV